MIIPQLNAVRDAENVERILIANSRTIITEVKPGLYDAESLTNRLAELRRSNRPFVVRSVAKSWNVVKKWGNVDDLLLQASNEEKASPNRKYTVYKPEPDGHLNQSHAAPFACMTFHKYLTCAKRNNLYMLGVPDKSGRGASPFEMRKGETDPPIFAEDIDNDPGPKIFSNLFINSTACRRHVFFNSAYSFTNLHYDTDWNTYLCVLGNRRWTIAHPAHARIVGASNGGASYSMLRPTKGMDGLEGSRLAHLIKFLRIDLSSGDVLCVPPTWWHVVEGMTDGFSCGINWFYTFPTIELGSVSDIGWDWMHPPSEQLLVKTSMMSQVNPVILRDKGTDIPEDKIQPDTAGNGLQRCADADFVDGICSDIRALYKCLPYNFSKLVALMDASSSDFIMARQLGRIIVNSVLSDAADAERCDSIAIAAIEIMDAREGYKQKSFGKRKR